MMKRLTIRRGPDIRDPASQMASGPAAGGAIADAGRLTLAPTRAVVAAGGVLLFGLASRNDTAAADIGTAAATAAVAGRADNAFSVTIIQGDAATVGPDYPRSTPYEQVDFAGSGTADLLGISSAQRIYVFDGAGQDGMLGLDGIASVTLASVTRATGSGADAGIWNFRYHMETDDGHGLMFDVDIASGFTQPVVALQDAGGELLLGVANSATVEQKLARHEFRAGPGDSPTLDPAAFAAPNPVPEIDFTGAGRARVDIASGATSELRVYLDGSGFDATLDIDAALDGSASIPAVWRQGNGAWQFSYGQAGGAAGAEATLLLDVVSGYFGGTPPSVAIAPDGAGGTLVTVACFAQGTRIAIGGRPGEDAPESEGGGGGGGERVVEALRVGDLVRTARGGARPVVWLGHRTLRCDRHPRPWDVRPVRVQADAFGPGRPRRDLVLSPDHALHVGGALIPVRHLLNGASVRQEAWPSVTYWHVELDRHDVLLAEGLPAESYLDTGNRAAFADGAAAVDLHPAFARAAWKAGGCARLVERGAKVIAARRRLRRGLGRLGWTVTEDAALSLELDGRPARARRHGDWLCLALPRAARTLRVLSRSAVPAEVDEDGTDGRTLGVPLCALLIDDAWTPTAHGRLRRGWHAPDRDGLRWSDGAGEIDVRGARTLALRLAAGLMRYPVRASAARRAGPRGNRREDAA
jgi:hypothetical protein